MATNDIILDYRQMEAQPHYLAGKTLLVFGR